MHACVYVCNVIYVVELYQWPIDLVSEVEAHKWKLD